jgi:hypothetical protein
MAEIMRFFLDYKVLEKKTVAVENLDGPPRAHEVVLEALALYRREEQRLRGW